eukprot:s5474_g1.t1
MEIGDFGIGMARAEVDPADGASPGPGNTPHDLAKDSDDKKVFVALLSGKD